MKHSDRYVRLLSYRCPMFFHQQTDTWAVHMLWMIFRHERNVTEYTSWFPTTFDMHISPIKQHVLHRSIWKEGCLRTNYHSACQPEVIKEACRDGSLWKLKAWINWAGHISDTPSCPDVSRSAYGVAIDYLKCFTERLVFSSAGSNRQDLWYSGNRSFTPLCYSRFRNDTSQTCTCRLQSVMSFRMGLRPYELGNEMLYMTKWQVRAWSPNLVIKIYGLHRSQI